MYDIIGNRIAFRLITEDDTDMVLQWRNSDEVKKYFIYKGEITKEDHLKWLNTKVNSGVVEQFVVYDKALNRPFASVYFRDIDKLKECAEYGVFIGDSKYVGKGYGCEIAKLMIAHGFSDIGLKRITLRVLGDNERAKKCYVNAGFCEDYVASQCIDGIMRDVIFMKVERDV